MGFSPEAREALASDGTYFTVKDYLADVLPLMDVLVSRGGLSQGKCLADHRLDLAGGVQPEDFLDFALQQSSAGLQISQTYANHGDILAHQLQRMENAASGQRRQSSSANSAFHRNQPMPKIRKSPAVPWGPGICGCGRRICRRSGP